MAPYPGPSPQPPSGSNVLIILFALVGIGAILFGVGAVVWGVSQITRARETTSASASLSSDVPTAKLPPVERRVPHHALSILDGCSSDDVRALASGIDGAIDVGAPLYNAGNFAGCYHMYEGTASDLERKLGETCVGPIQALEAGRTRAATLTTSSAQAWAMRDAFDGLIDVVVRSQKKR
jgi:hypothetical protein